MEYNRGCTCTLAPMHVCLSEQLSGWAGQVGQVKHGLHKHAHRCGCAGPCQLQAGDIMSIHKMVMNCPRLRP